MIAIYAIYLVCVIITEVIVYLIVCLITSKKKTQPKIQIKIAEKSLETLEFLNEKGGTMLMIDIKDGLGLETISSVTGRINSLIKNGLVIRIHTNETEIGGKTTLVKITEKGINYLLQYKKEL